VGHWTFLKAVLRGRISVSGWNKSQMLVTDLIFEGFCVKIAARNAVEQRMNVILSP
jgi:hypothetical protein